MMRLRSVADNVLLPADADLVPALLADEADALGRQRGLVFLPGERVLAFTPQAPLPLAALLGGMPLQRPAWSPLPPRPALAERLTAIALEQPPEAPEAILDAGGEGIGTETPRPDDAGTPSKVLGKAAFSVGKGMAWLGKKLNLRGLTRAGAQLMGGAMNLVPRLSERVLGQQEASLRDLLRDFREGRIERALRRALPLGGDTPRGATPAQSGRLPTNSILYSLQNILGGGPASIWFGRFDAYHELEREYRKQAELAARNGDFRRAAFIYGKLLRDYRSAAAALAQGGLHHDAAILYLTQLQDKVAAAGAFEAAGELERALQLYRQCGAHALAGDLLRRAGEEELAVEEYRLAALKLVSSGQGHYQAGELLLTRARRPDLARVYYQSGWDARPRGSAVPCVLRLAQLHAQEGTLDGLAALVAEAESFLAPPGHETPAAEFFNEIARLADQPALVPVRDDLRDRALLAIAAQMRHRAQDRARSSLVPTFLAPAGGWSAATVSDAAYAMRGASRPAPRANPNAMARTALPARVQVVTAVVHAGHTGELFLGFQSGEVYRYSPLHGEVRLLTDERVPVVSLATDAEGDGLVVLTRKKDERRASVSSFSGSVGYRMVASQTVPLLDEHWLCPLIQDRIVGLYAESCVQFLGELSLFPTTYQKVGGPCANFRAALLFPAFGKAGAHLALLAFDGEELLHYPDLEVPHANKETLNWEPARAKGSDLYHPIVSWLRKGLEAIELACIWRGAVYALDAEFQEGLLARVATTTATAEPPYRAVAVVRAGLLAAVTANEVHWLRRGADGFRRVATVRHFLPPPVACFPHYRGNQLLVVCGDGTVARVPDLRH
jgi:tetratricopeptide (TPR) repeat protein